MVFSFSALPLKFLKWIIRFWIYNKMSQVKKSTAETASDSTERKNPKDFGQSTEQTASEVYNKMKKGVEGVSEKIEKAVDNLKQATIGSSNQSKAQAKMENKENSVMNKLEKEIKKVSNNMQKQNAKSSPVDWEQGYMNADADIKKSLKQEQNSLASELEKIYQGALKNCLKQSEDQPHKLKKCWQEFSTKMSPVYEKLQERSKESAETLKKCFESKRNARDCIDQGIKFGQRSLNDASNSIKTYLS